MNMASNFSICILCTLMISPLSFSGTLDDLEQGATSPSKRSSSSSSNNRSSNSNEPSLGDELVAEATFGIAKFFVENFVEITGYTVAAIIMGGDNSRIRYNRTAPLIIENEKNTNFQDELFRVQGDPILPTVRISSQWIAATDGITGQLNRIEMGHGFFGMSYTENTLNESGDELTISNAMLHYRMSFGNNFSWDFAYGKGRMNGNQKHDGSVFSMPIRFRIDSNIHLEYQPTWSSYKGGSLTDHQLSLNYQYKNVGVSAGFKKWSAWPAKIEGLFTGLYMVF